MMRKRMIATRRHLHAWSMWLPACDRYRAIDYWDWAMNKGGDEVTVITIDDMAVGKKRSMADTERSKEQRPEKVKQSWRQRGVGV